MPTDYKIPAANNFLPDHYVVDGKEFKSKVETVKHVKSELECSMTEAINYVEALPDLTN